MRVFKLLFAIIFVSTMCNAQSEQIEFQGNQLTVSTTNHLELVPSDTAEIWVNAEKFIKFQISVHALSRKQLTSKVRESIDLLPSRVLLSSSTHKNSSLLTVKELHNESIFQRLTLISGDNDVALEVSISFPQRYSDQLAETAKLMLNELSWEKQRVADEVTALPFLLNPIPGFKVTQQYLNSVVMRSFPENEAEDIMIVISSLQNKNSATELGEKMSEILRKSHSLSEISIINSELQLLHNREISKISASATLKSNHSKIDLLQWGYNDGERLIIMQIMTNKGTVSLIKLNDILAQILFNLDSQ